MNHLLLTNLWWLIETFKNKCLLPPVILWGTARLILLRHKLIISAPFQMLQTYQLTEGLLNTVQASLFRIQILHILIPIHLSTDYLLIIHSIGNPNWESPSKQAFPSPACDRPSGPPSNIHLEKYLKAFNVQTGFVEPD